MGNSWKDYGRSAVDKVMRKSVVSERKIMENKVCPTCDGYGYFNVSDNDEGPIQPVFCKTCNGEGEVYVKL